MKRYTALLLFSFIFSSVGYAQYSFGNFAVTGGEGIRKLAVADIDGDGDKDIILATYGFYTIHWAENLDGEGNYGPIQLIHFSDTSIIADLATGDIDGDGDIDLVAADNYDRRVIWFRNQDGQGTFSEAITVSATLGECRGVKVGDIDGDGDLDIASGDTSVRVLWYENLDSNGNFGLANIIATDTGSDFPQAIYLVDVDGDSDLDALSKTFYNDKIVLNKNLDGLGNFGPNLVLYTFPDGARLSSLMFADFDGDDDMDIGFTDYTNVPPAHFGWLENTDGLGDFSLVQLIENALRYQEAGAVDDVDGDGDMDMIIEAFDNAVSRRRLMWFRNDGTGNLNTRIDIADVSEIWALSMDDLNNDTRKDIVFVNSSRIGWFKNTDDPLGIQENNEQTTIVFPNPVIDVLNISNTFNEVSIELFDALGRPVLISESVDRIDMSGFSSGFYLLKINRSNGGQEALKVIKR